MTAVAQPIPDCTPEEHEQRKRRLELANLRHWNDVGLIGDCPVCLSSLMVRDPDDRRVAEGIAEKVARQHGVVPLAVFSTNTDARSVAARAAVALELRDVHGWTLERIGRAIGRATATVLHLIRRARAS